MNEDDPEHPVMLLCLSVVHFSGSYSTEWAHALFFYDPLPLLDVDVIFLERDLCAKIPKNNCWQTFFIIIISLFIQAEKDTR